VTEAHVREQLA